MQRLLNGFPVRVLLGGALALFLAVTATAVARAQATNFGPSVWDGTFTAAQAQRGATAFAEHCAECHGNNLQGGEGTALAGDKFWSDWRESTVDALLSFISKNMPYDDNGVLAGKLSAGMYSDIVAHILNTNGFPSGSTELNATTAVGVQIIRREGPGDLPTSTLARVVGCLEKVPGGFQLVKGSRAVRAEQAKNTPAAQVPLGDKTYALKFLVLPLDRFVGQKMQATGLLIGDGGVDGINVDNVSSVSPTCQ